MAGAAASSAVGIDLSPEMLAEADAEAALAVADVRAIPIAPDSFDVVWCRLVAQLNGAVGPLVRHLYKKARRLDLYQAHFGTRLVIAFAFMKSE